MRTQNNWASILYFPKNWVSDFSSGEKEVLQNFEDRRLILKIKWMRWKQKVEPWKNFLTPGNLLTWLSGWLCKKKLDNIYCLISKRDLSEG